MRDNGLRVLVNNPIGSCRYKCYFGGKKTWPSAVNIPRYNSPRACFLYNSCAGRLAGLVGFHDARRDLGIAASPGQRKSRFVMRADIN